MPDLSQWLINQGVSIDILLILTFVPLFVTITAFSRYVSGIKTFGIYASMVLAFAFYYMGMVQGLMITLLVVASSWIIRNMIKGIRLHYLARLAIVYCGNALFILGLIVITSVLPFESPYLDFSYIPALPLVLIVSITDRLVANYIKKDLLSALRLTLETLIIALICWAIMRWDVTREFFLTNLWVIPLLIVINALIGNYAGFRWSEFIRFNQVIRNVESTDDAKKK